MLIMASAGSTAAFNMSWSVEKRIEQQSFSQSSVIQYSVSNAITRISSIKETIFIDYQALRLYRLSNADQACSGYVFEKADKNAPLAETLVLPYTEEIQTSSVSKIRKYIIFGGRLAFHQMIKAPVVHRYGQNFALSIIGYSATDSLPDLKRLFDLAEQHRQIFLDYPLLRQLDPIGLLELLGGFPMESEQHIIPAGKLTATLKIPPHDDPEATITVPRKCLDTRPSQ
jgi:hypothetical protein